MKKIIIVGTCIVSVYCIYGMEEQAGFRQQLYSTKGSTTIHLIKDKIYDRQRSQYPDISVVGIYEQRRLQERKADYLFVGDLGSTYQNIIYIKNEQIESDSEDDNYYPARANGGIVFFTKNGVIATIEKPWDYTKKVISPGTIVTVVEPEVFYAYNYYSYINRKCIDKTIETSGFEGAKAISEAQKDLELCYCNVLEKAHTKFTDDKKRTIAFPSLGIGIPKQEASLVAITAVLKYIENNPDKYNSIEFVIKNRKEFSLYKVLLDKQLSNTTIATDNISTHISTNTNK